MLTEEQAKEKWCPFVRVNFISQSAIFYSNRSDVLDNDAPEEVGALMTRCIGSACMSWRWGEPPKVILDSDTLEETITEPGKGFCGLAGIPLP